MIQNNLTIVFQGPILPITKMAIESAKIFFPSCKVIVSTWNGSSLLGLNDVDLFVLTEDPGGTICSFDDKVLDNTNRQIISSYEGLKKVVTKYAIKARTDVIFTSNSCINLFDRYKSYDYKYKFLSKRVIVVAEGTVNSYNTNNMPFHVCDWFYFGLTKDLIKIFEIDLKSKSDIIYFKHLDDLPSNAKYKNFKFRFAPESHIFGSFAKKNIPDLKFEHMYDTSCINLSMRVLVNNIQCVELTNIGIVWEKYKYNKIKNCVLLNDTLNEVNWLFLYNKFSNGREKIRVTIYYYICKTLNFLYKKIK